MILTDVVFVSHLFQECFMKTPSKKFRNRRMFVFSFLFLVVAISLATAVMGSKRKIKVMPLGDSITGSFEGSASYRFWLWEQLVSAGFADKVDFVGKRCGCGDINGECGQPQFPCSVWPCNHNGYHDRTIGMILGMVGSLCAVDTPDVVLLHLGTNDIISPDATGDLSVSKSEMESLIDKIRVYNPNVTILLCKIIPSIYDRDSFPVFNRYMDQVAVEKTQAASPIVIVDQYTGYVPWPGQDNDVDGVHPTESGEKKIANKYFGALLPILQKMTALHAVIGNYKNDVLTTGGSLYTVNAKVNAYPQVKDVTIVTNDSIPVGLCNKVNDSLYTFNWVAPLSGLIPIKTVVSDFCGHTDTSVAVLFGTPMNSSAIELSIPQIQGPIGTSPYENQWVKTTGIVTAIAKDSSGFWMQDSLGDGSDLTSDAIFVSKSNTVSIPAVNNAVSVRGIVQEYVEKPGCLSGTRLRCVDSISVLYNFGRRPAALSVSSVENFNMNSMKSSYAGHEGMLVSFDNVHIVSPGVGAAFSPWMNRSGSGYSWSNGVFENESRGANVVDYNPEVLLLGNTAGSLGNVRINDTISNLTGIVNYQGGNFYIQPLADSMVFTRIIGAGMPFPPSPVSVRNSGAGSFRITTLDCDGFYDTIDTWNKNDIVVSAATYTTKLAKITKAISQELLMPALLCVQNVENTNVMNDIAASINAIGGKYKIATGRTYLGFSIDTPSTPNPSGLINAFLYDSTEMKLSQTILLQGGSFDAAFGPASAFPCAEPIVGAFSVGGSILAVVNVTLADKTSDQPFFMKDWPAYEPSKAARMAQASAVRSWINSVLSSYPSVYMLIVGEFNDYGFAEPNDIAGYPVSIVAGNAGKGETVFYNAYDYLPQDTRFTCIRDGRAQMTSHILISPNLAGAAKAVDVLHFNSKFEDGLAGNPATPIRVSKHDAVEIRF